MGIHCQINLFKQSDGAYLTGSTVEGIIQYGVDQDTIFDSIIVSLKGHGVLSVYERTQEKKRNYTNSEAYVDIDNIVSAKEIPHKIGMYETRFAFKLPEEIPSSLDFNRTGSRCNVRCKIGYYIRIKFEKPGFFKFSKRFRKEITVISRIKPKLLNEPIMYGQQKKLFQLFSRKKSTVNIKANIRNPVISPGENINLDYEVCNDTNLNVKGVVIKLVELYTFIIKSGQKFKIYSDIDDAQMKSGSIKSDEIQNIDFVIKVPTGTDTNTLEYSKLVSREYFLQLTTELPFPHIDAVLEVPVEIIEKGQETVALQDSDIYSEDCEGRPDYENPPPSYWEAMGEDIDTR